MPDAHIDRPVLSVEEALERILATVSLLEPEQVGLLEAEGRVLLEKIVADRDIPPLTNAAMDGYAVRGEDVADGPTELRIVGEAAAGHVSDVILEPGQAVRIMTGAPVPKGADTVVRFEDTRTDGLRVDILGAYTPGKNVRQAGEDVRASEVVLQPGRVLRPQAIGMLAAVGRTSVKVGRKPRVAILATGDEIVPPGEDPGPGQIRDANSYAVAAQVQTYSGVPLVLDIARDQESRIREGVWEALAQRPDLIITSGGVSVGDFDLVKQVLAAEGKIHFWSLNMKPGRPLAFGMVGGIPLIGLPGNPVAAMISTELFARPALLKMQGAQTTSAWTLPTVRARLTEPIARKDGRRHYLRVSLQRTETGYEATLTGDQGSGILKSMVIADGLAVIPEDADHLPKESEIDVLLLPQAG